jgi:chemotaxis family two-component system sensor kinase Cph1
MEGGNRMRELINGVLAYSKVDTQGKKFAPVDMGMVVANVLAVLRLSIEETKAEITIDPLPKVMADESQMMQVMQNLIGNALKFHGPDRTTIHISSSEGEREWIFAIKDNGIGLDMADAEKIFLMFQRLHKREEFPGTGIGLALTKKIVERHHGRIWVESSLGAGAIFLFTIPTTDIWNGKRMNGKTIH